MAKKQTTVFEQQTPTHHRHKKRGLHIRKKLGPKSNMRIR